MRWKNTETPTFAGSAGSGSAPSVAETLEAVDKDGNVVVAITKSVAGAISMEINGEAVPSLDSVSSTELGYLDGVTSAIQTQLDAKTTQAWTVVASAAATVSPTAADSGKYYRCAHAAATFNLPTTGLTVGATEFYLTFPTNSLSTIDAGSGKTIDSVNSFDGTPSVAQTAVNVMGGHMIHMKYVATNVWAGSVLTYNP